MKIKENVNKGLNKVKKEIKSVKKDDSGQGAAEYIMLFGGVIAIAILALLIYSSYFSSGQTSLNASNDVNEVRNAMNYT